MAFLLEDSKLLATYYLQCKGAILLALLRWVLSWALRARNRAAVTLSSLASGASLRSRPSSSRAPPEILGDGLPVSTYGDVAVEILQASCCDPCAVCFSPLVEGDEVRVLRNCRHVYHRECLDRWVGYDHHHHHHRHDDGSNRQTCPLCRAPLWGPPSPQSLKWGRTEPRWSVKRLCSSFWGCDL